MAAAGGILVLLGLLPKLGAVVAALPAPVLGGAGLVMFGTVAASGLRTLAGVEFRDNHNLTVVAVSVAVGMLPVGVPTVYAKFPDWFQTVINSGISAGCLTAILLNLLFNHLAGGAVQPVATPPRRSAWRTAAVRTLSRSPGKRSSRSSRRRPFIFAVPR